MLNPEELLPALSIDCVIFGFHDNKLKVLLMRFKGLDKWNLPGGFIRKDEDVDAAAAHVLKDRTGLKEIFLTQFQLFGNLSRNDAKHDQKVMDMNVIPAETEQWFSQRFVSVGYYALVEYSKAIPESDDISDACEWFSLDELPKLILDHKEILEKALSTLRMHLKYQPIGLNLLPKKFTLPELHALYETLLGVKMDRRNFQRKITGYGILNKLDERKEGVAHRAPFLYSFNKEKYNQALKEGFNSIW